MRQGRQAQLSKWLWMPTANVPALAGVMLPSTGLGHSLSRMLPAADLLAFWLSTFRKQMAGGGLYIVLV